MFLNKNDVDLLNECGFLKTDIKSLIKEFRNNLSEENEDYSQYIKNEE